MDLAEKSPVLDGEGLTIGLAHDLRKAYENQREKEKVEVWDDTLTIYGVEQVWPTFILQVALMRSSLSFVDATKYEQSSMYRLEACLYDAFKIYLPAYAYKIIQCYEDLLGRQEAQISDIPSSRVSYFLSLTKAKRASQLAEILHSISPMFKHFPHSDNKRLTPRDFASHSWDTLMETRL